MDWFDGLPRSCAGMPIEGKYAQCARGMEDVETLRPVIHRILSEGGAVRP